MMKGQEMFEAPVRLPGEYYAEGERTKNGGEEGDFVVIEKDEAVAEP